MRRDKREVLPDEVKIIAVSHMVVLEAVNRGHWVLLLTVWWGRKWRRKVRQSPLEVPEWRLRID